MAKAVKTAKYYEIVACGKPVSGLQKSYGAPEGFAPRTYSHNNKKDSERTISLLKGESELVHIEMSTIICERIPGTKDPDKKKVVLITDEVYWDRQPDGNWRRTEM